MKKIISILLILCVIGAAFAADSEVTFNGMTAVDSRSPAMGGSHIADTSDYFTLLRNPAGLAFSGRHNLIGQTNINIGGPLEQVYNIAMTPGKLELLQNDQNALITEASSLISANALNLGLSVGGPIAIGGTYKGGFGWGLFDQVIVGAAVPSSIAKVNAELDLDLVFGYGKAIDFGPLGKLAIGLSTDIYAQAPYVNVKMNALDLLSGGDPMAMITNALLLNASGGVNINAGVQYRLLGDFLNIAAVYGNLISTYSKASVVFDQENFDPMALIPQPSALKTEAFNGTLKLGVGLNIPTGWSLGLISSWGIYADINDVASVLKNDPLGRNPILDMSVGTEMTLLKFISIRGGISDSYLNAGVGVRLLGLHIDASIYGKELGTEPGATPQLNCAISIGIRH